MANKVTTKKESAYLCSDEFATSISFSKFIKMPQLPRVGPSLRTCKSITSALPHYMDFFLQSIVTSFSSYIKVSGQSITSLKSFKTSWAPTYSWQSLDVRDDRGLNSLHYFLITDGNINPIQASFISKYTKFALEH